MFTMILFPGDTPCRQFNPRLVDGHWSRCLLRPSFMISGPAAYRPPVLLNVYKRLVVPRCDSFNSLNPLVLDN